MSCDAGKGVLFVGLTCVDIVNVCDHYPEEDSDQRVLDQRWQRGGNASNSCTVFAKLLKWFHDNCDSGGQNYFVQCFGTLATDNMAKFLIEDFSRLNIKIDGIEIHENDSTPSTCVIINSQNGSRTILHSNKEPSAETFMKLDLTKFIWIHFEGRNVLQARNMIKHIRKIDSQRKITVSVEIEKPREVLKEFFDEDIDYLFVGKDFSSYCGYDTPEDACDRLIQILSPGITVICPWGERGVSAAKRLADGRKQNFYSPIFSPKFGVVDTLGAGDTCIAAIVFAITVLAYTVKEAIKFGCRVAGAKCGMHGFERLHEFKNLIE
ncbi:ketohexokinase-like isoform X2 [Dinothrombium tinctorium]|uniref:Ketohexokinase-like isoform X2 n=1 Tax=Dinothrombium tinctorium TaxID=1965070 RepID=A0A3S3NEU3_9ACAR|nr:ketohexokinase-like isoform X2 [Dinothrombium tinctorium]